MFFSTSQNFISSHHIFLLFQNYSLYNIFLRTRDLEVVTMAPGLVRFVVEKVKPVPFVGLTVLDRTKRGTCL